MKTTLDINDQLLANARMLAVQQRTSLTRLIEEGLQLRLRSAARPSKLPKSRIPVLKGRGGLVAGVKAFQVPLRLWQQAAPWLFVAGVALLLLVLVPQVGRSVNGAQRWIGLGPINLQPSELMKLFAVLYAADYTARKLDDMGSFVRGFFPMALVMVLVGVLLLREPDFGALVVILAQAAPRRRSLSLKSE